MAVSSSKLRKSSLMDGHRRQRGRRRRQQRQKQRRKRRIQSACTAAPNAPPLFSSAPSSPFVLAPENVARIRESLGVDEKDDEALLSHLIKQAAIDRACPPISRFHVGAAALGSSGAVYLGVNVELTGAPLSQSIHGEQFVVANAFGHGERRIETLAVNELPCGHCRQFLAELEDRGSMCIFVTRQGLRTTHDELLPHAFTPDQLQEGGNVRYLLSAAPDAALELSHSNGGDCDDLVQAALEAAKKSYAPYSRCESGVALRLACGSILTGAYLESAAYNPSLPPLQVALVNTIIAGKGPAESYDSEWSNILDVVLVERAEALVKQEDITRAVIAGIAPAATFRVVSCTSTSR